MNKYLKIAFVFAVTYIASLTFVNAQNKCGTPEYLQKTLEKDPKQANARADFEAYVKSFVNSPDAKSNQRTSGSSGKRIVPVVFHIVHQWGAENISKAKVLSQLAELNKDYNRSNPDTVAGSPGAAYAAFRDRVANPQIEFRLATKDPYGRPTDGIERIASFTSDQAGGDTLDSDVPKMTSDWDSRKYFNVWVVSAIHSPPNSQIEAYATFPTSRQFSPYRDGVLTRADVVGTGVASRILSHEMGHWFSMYHIWGDAICGTDYVDDTPIAHDQNNGFPVFPSRLNRTCVNRIDSLICIKDSLGKSPKTGVDTILCACADSNYHKKHNSGIDSIVVCGDRDRKRDTSVIDRRDPANLVRAQDTILGEMFINYMDYTNSASQNMFTKGQLARINATLDTVNGPRNILVRRSNSIETGTDDASYPAASAVGGIPKAFYYVNGNHVNSKVFVSCASDSVLFEDNSTNGVVQTRQWSFPGGSASSTTGAKVRVKYTTPGSYDVTLTVSNVNGSSSLVNTNSVIVRPSAWYPASTFKDGFESTYFTDMGWNAIDGQNNYNDSAYWQKTDAASFTGKSSMVLRNFDNHHVSKFDVDELISPPVQIRASDKNVNLVFYTSAAQKSKTCSARLNLYYSIDCGKSWLPMPNKPTILGKALFNAGVYIGDFIPTQSFLWQKQSIDVSSLSGQGSLLFKFQFLSAKGDFKAQAEANNIYIDDVGFEGTWGIEDQIASNLNLDLYPNPAANETNLTFNLEKESVTKIILSDVTGRVLSVIADEKLGSGEHQYKITNKYGAGIYMLKMKIGEYETVRKVIFN